LKLSSDPIIPYPPTLQNPPKGRRDIPAKIDMLRHIKCASKHFLDWLLLSKEDQLDESKGTDSAVGAVMTSVASFLEKEELLRGWVGFLRALGCCRAEVQIYAAAVFGIVGGASALALLLVPVRRTTME
jgi:hypothetical protein